MSFCHLIISLTACSINDLEDELESLKLYYEWIFLSKSHEKEVLHAVLALLVKKDIFLNDLEIDLLTLKVTLNIQNNFRNGLPSQHHVKIRYGT